MTSKEKIDQMLNEIRERARLSSLPAVFVDLLPVYDGGLSVVSSPEEQFAILEKFEEDGLLQIWKQEKDRAMVLITGLDIDSDESPYAASMSGTQLPKSVETDLRKGILSIAGKPVSISTKAGKENNPMRLLKTLLKRPKEYWYEDEILEDWEGLNVSARKERIPNNRVYHAARDLNTRIAKKAGVNDYIEYDTKKFRINPRYLRPT